MSREGRGKWGRHVCRGGSGRAEALRGLAGGAAEPREAIWAPGGGTSPGAGAPVRSLGLRECCGGWRGCRWRRGWQGFLSVGCRMTAALEVGVRGCPRSVSGFSPRRSERVRQRAAPQESGVALGTWQSRGASQGRCPTGIWGGGWGGDH